MSVPRDQREAALGLGQPGGNRRGRLWCVRATDYGSIFLALARALGETMAVTM